MTPAAATATAPELPRPTLEDAPASSPRELRVSRRELVPFLAGALLPYVIAAFPPYDYDFPALYSGGAITLVIGILAFGAAHRGELTAGRMSALALCYLPAVALVREAAGGGVSGYGPLVLLPLLAISLYGSRLALGACIVGIGLVLALPIVIIGGDNYDQGTELRRTIIWVILSLLVGPTVQRLVSRTRESELQFRSVFDNVREVIFQTDEDGRWTLLNPAWEEITGYRVTESIGKPFVDFVHPDDRAGNHALFLQLTGREIDSYRYEMRYQVADGRYRWLEVAARRTTGASGDEAGVSGTLTDITDRYESEQMKEQFFALVSHELRTPLAAIIGYLELLDEEEGERLSEDGREFVAVMQRNSQRLMRLIGDLLFAAQVEAGTLSLVRGPVDLAAIAEHAVSSARPRAEDRELTLGLDLPDEPIELDADSQRLGQVFDNLLTNAIKFTPAGGRIDVRVATEDGTAVIEVADTGQGIAPEDQERLFERFARSASADEQAIQGVGLGLAITRAIVDGHAGRIGLRSELGRGTTFRVELPLDPLDPAQEDLLG